MSSQGQDIVLAQRIAVAWREEGLRIDAIEVWPIPRPTGGTGLCLNFRVTYTTSLESALEDVSKRIRTALMLLIDERETQKYTALQFGFTMHAIGSSQTEGSPGGRFFFESPEVRKLETTPQLLANTPLEQLATVKQLTPALLEQIRR